MQLRTWAQNVTDYRIRSKASIIGSDNGHQYVNQARSFCEIRKLPTILCAKETCRHVIRQDAICFRSQVPPPKLIDELPERSGPPQLKTSPSGAPNKELSSKYSLL